MSRAASRHEGEIALARFAQMPLQDMSIAQLHAVAGIILHIAPEAAGKSFDASEGATSYLRRNY